MNIAHITIAFTYASETMVRERIKSLHFENYGVDHGILSVKPGHIPDDQDECNLTDYRQLYDLGILPTNKEWRTHVPKGCTSYIAHVRL